MDLERTAAVLRVRTGWEASDLGIAMLRRWWRPLLGGWLLVTLPLAVVLAGLLHEHPFWALLILMALEPFLDRLALHVLSRALFGATPSARDLLRELPRFASTAPVRVWLRYRWMGGRAVIQPIALLEGLRGKALRARERLLLERQRGSALAIGLVAQLASLVVTLGLMGLVLFIAPKELLPPFADGLPFGSLEQWLDPSVSWLAWVTWIAALLGWSLGACLNTCAGFALYVNRRTLLEGWDVDLAFRRIAERARRERAGREAALERAGASAARAARALLIAVLVGFASLAGRAHASAPSAHALAAARPGSSAAQGDPGAPSAPTPTPGEVAREVLAGPDFGGFVERREWSFSGGPDSSGVWALGSALQVAGWIAAGLALAAVVYTVLRQLAPRAETGAAEHEPEAPSELFGLDLRPESLPADVVGAARAHWRAGRAVEALGLLYRAAIAALVGAHGLRLQRSDTEGDCLARVESLPDRARAACFSELTRAWLVSAYSAQRPSEAEVERLFESFARHFAGGAR